MNWGRQNTQSLQAVLAVAPLKKGNTRKCMEILSVCVSSTICVYRTAKWFKLVVRGTFETEKLRRLSGPTRGVRSESKKTIAACLGKLSQNAKCRCDAESGASLSHRSDGSCC